METPLRFEIVDPQSDAAVESMLAYFAELDLTFDSGFDPGDTIIEDAHHFRPPEGRFVVGYVGADVASCGGVQFLGPQLVEIKRMWVSPDQRGKGVGAKTLTRLEEVAVELGASRIRLDTNSSLTTAIEMYTSRGYRDIEPYNDNPFAQRWFEKSISR